MRYTETQPMIAKWIFFDLGWTLVDESQAHVSRMERVQPYLKEIGINKSVQECMDDCEASASKFAESPYTAMLKSYGLSDDQLERAKLIAPYVKADELLYDGVPELLRQLASRYKIGIIANQSKGTLKRLEAWEIQEHFKLVFASYEAGLSKPDPRIFQAALSNANCNAVDAIMIGDRLDNDIGPANTAGWKTIRVLQGFSRHQEPRNEAEHPSFVVKEIKEVLSLL